MKTYRLNTPGPSGDLDYEKELNPQQLEVVQAAQGVHLVIAGAGSGKTRTLTYRVARLMERGVAADRIALCTFTNKAAKEMLSRVEHLVEGENRRVWGGTFHHLANRLLREMGGGPGYQEGYSILDQEDANELLKDCIASQNPGRKRKLGLRPAVVSSLIGLAINTLTPLDQIVLNRAPALIQRLDEVLAAAEVYRERKLAMNAMDFDDLLYNLYRILVEPSDIQASLRDRFAHVLVDEYQDTSPLQCALVDQLSSKVGNLTVVGDDAQSIYGFRGADPTNIFSFTERWPDAQLHKLEINYRSSPQVLALANASISHNQRQVPKQLEATCPDGTLPALIPVRDSAMEAAFIAQRIAELDEEGISLDEMAVLYRAHHHSMELQVELTRRGIPYLVRSGVRFFEQAHIKDVLAHLRIVVNPREELSWLRVLRLQPGIGRAGAARIFDELRTADDPLAGALMWISDERVPPRSRPGWKRLLRILKKLDESQARIHASVAIQAVLEGGYADQLSTMYNNPQSREEDIIQLAEYADRFDDTQTFLSELNLLASFASEIVKQPGEIDQNLTLSTVHQAKGLEWRVVFVLALNENAFPHPRAMTEEGGLEEERRLFYVAVTRTKDQLYLLTRQVDDRPGQRRLLLKQSQFIKEIEGQALFERWAIEEAT